VDIKLNRHRVNKNLCKDHNNSKVNPQVWERGASSWRGKLYTENVVISENGRLDSTDCRGYHARK
jgi:hypothetical protein